MFIMTILVSMSPTTTEDHALETNVFTVLVGIITVLCIVLNAMGEFYQVIIGWLSDHYTALNKDQTYSSK